MFTETCLVKNETFLCDVTTLCEPNQVLLMHSGTCQGCQVFFFLTCQMLFRVCFAFFACESASPCDRAIPVAEPGETCATQGYTTPGQDEKTGRERTALNYRRQNGLMRRISVRSDRHSISACISARTRDDVNRVGHHVEAQRLTPTRPSVSRASP